MPVIDTEVLFSLNPRDSKHEFALRLLKARDDLMAPDTAIFKFQVVLRARGRNPSEIKIALWALHEALARHAVKEVKTITTDLLVLQCDLEKRYEPSYFDSLIAASTLALDRNIVSDDKSFNKVPEIERIPLIR